MLIIRLQQYHSAFCYNIERGSDYGNMKILKSIKKEISLRESYKHKICSEYLENISRDAGSFVRHLIFMPPSLPPAVLCSATKQRRNFHEISRNEKLMPN